MTIHVDDTYSLGRAWRYANPRTATDYLPAIYGEMSGGNKGLWICPCIDTVNYYYLIADHTVLSAADGNAFTVYDKDNNVIDSANYTIVDDHTDENGKHVSIINFTSDQEANEPISVRCKGKNSGSSLIENPIEQIEDFIINLAGGASGDFEAYALQRAKTACASYKSAGAISGDQKIGTTLSEILYSFHGDWWINHQGKIVISMNIIDQVYPWKDEILEHAIETMTATRDEQNLCNQAEVEYAYNYRTNKYEDGDDGSSTADQLSQSIHGVKKTTFQFKWCRDAAAVALIQAIIVNRLKNPIWLIDITENSLDHIHFERGDFILFNNSSLFDNTGSEFENRIVQILTRVLAYDDKKVSLELIDKGVSYHHYDAYPEEAINITELIMKSVTKNVAEQISITETIAKEITKSISEGVAITEVTSKYVEKAIFEGVSITERAWLNEFQYDGVYRHDGSIRYGADYAEL